MSKLIGDILGVVLIFCISALFLGLPLMLLWNWLMPMLFGLIKITFFQAIGLYFLAGILFKSSTSNKD